MRDLDWEDEKSVRCISDIVASSVAGHSGKGLWPSHVDDLENPNDQPNIFYTDMYFGSAGILWALDRLKTFGYSSELDYESLIEECLKRHLCQDLSYYTPSSYFLGELGVRLIKHQVAPSDENAAQLVRLAEEGCKTKGMDPMLGLPGMLVGLSLVDLDEPKVTLILKRGVLRLLDGLTSSLKQAESGQKSPLSDATGRFYLGAAHGIAGVLYSCYVASAKVGDKSNIELIRAQARNLLHRMSILSENRVNWPTELGGVKLVAQWCHGAPGIITSLAPIFRPTDEREVEILEQAGHLIYEAGPLRKGVGLCHGTAGNGFSMLYLHRLTGKKAWLERAQTFAMNAISQHEEIRQVTLPRHSLWTGDLGLAMYLLSFSCPELGLPTLGYL